MSRHRSPFLAALFALFACGLSPLALGSPADSRDGCVEVELTEQAPVELCEEHFSDKARQTWLSLSPEARARFNERREKVMQFAAERITQYSYNLVGQATISKVLRQLDSRLVENADRINGCQQFGYCAGVGISTALGVNLAVVGAGVWGSVEYLYDFESGRWTKNFVRDIEKAKRAIVPSVSATAAFRVLFYFSDRDPKLEEEVTVTYLPASAVLFSGEHSWGFGLAVGPPSLPPIVSQFAVTSYTTKRKRYPRACEQALAIAPRAPG